MIKPAIDGAGSAPRVRGTGSWCGGRSAGCRFSPACAGNGNQDHARLNDNAVQPRVCGERVGSARNRPHSYGSAPRVRGTGPFWGERDRLAGSAPRVRGTATVKRQHAKAGRFSPACAGNGLTPCTMACAVAVQPRVCGERLTDEQRGEVYSGSAPRVRGTGLNGRLKLNDGRFSPACAGNGVGHWPLHWIQPVQPRVCGERNVMASAVPLAAGSAPRVRGTGCRTSAPAAARRFSPACAGNGSPRALRGWQCPVQPRVCGERP